MEVTSTARFPVRSVAVLGAGTMGAQIAAHFANAGVPARLLDLSEAEARKGLAKARALKPSPFFTQDDLRLVTTAGFDNGLSLLAGADWVIEAVLEQLDVKRDLLARVDRHRRPGSIVSSNTSGIPVSTLASGRSDDFQRHFLGTHFFNPPRYLHLVELIPAAATDEALTSAVSQFCDHRLGKGVVIARDRPNFIANHIGLYGACRTLDVLASGRYSVPEIDALTGPIAGRPKSATFRTIDISGLDVLAAVARNLADHLDNEDDRRAFLLPSFVTEMIARGWLGEKTGQGFYRRERASDGRTRLFALDPGTMAYRPVDEAPRLELDRFLAISDLAERTRGLFTDEGRVGAFFREALAPALIYTSRVALDIAHSLDDVDRAMRWGYGWELGPLETLDAIGVQEVVAAAGSTSPLADEALKAGRSCIRTAWAPHTPGLLILDAARHQGRVVHQNRDASLIDLDDGVLAVELHSKLNIIGAGTLDMIATGLERSASGFSALVIGAESVHFSAGADLAALLRAIHQQQWAAIDQMVCRFQAVVLGLRYADVPVIVAAAGMTLGGGCEIMLHADRVQAAAETYAGLVETGVGLIPAAGGTKELLARCTDEDASASLDLTRPARRAFEMIGLARTSTSASEAREMGYLRAVDGVTMNRERLISDAKSVALGRVRDGYSAPQRRDLQVGGEGVRAALELGVHLASRAGRLSDHDVLVGRKLAWVLAGGSLPHASRVTESYMLDLEREAFLSLCGEPGTHARIAYTLKTGKPLRN